jgi:hypothetical protein
MFKHSVLAALALAASVGTASALTLAPRSEAQTAANMVIDTAQVLRGSPLSSFAAQIVEFRSGALWWITNLSMPTPMPCEVLNGDAVMGCLTMKAMLAQKD